MCVLIWSSSIVEDIEEAFSFNSLDNSSGLVGLLVLLLLLDLLLGGVLAFVPLDGSTFNLLNIVLIATIEDFDG
jgi:hypothetical protein